MTFLEALNLVLYQGKRVKRKDWVREFLHWDFDQLCCFDGIDMSYFYTITKDDINGEWEMIIEN